ncbi:hypothetical protein Egran_04027 [Elaphomyces granulatus]|uniref:Uncharacterized protein n=1 Tax=Elaphomyces granulatus TaxID=519963 RepID=A0A232LVK2_9EURO|nr:hypothetical protein Egran_04027 [Elaphomyces granulatus]
MAFAAPAPVGSGLFFFFALLVICLLVLLLLRRFLPLRTTPAFITVPVFLALVLPASLVLLVPIDLASSSRAGARAKGIWLPDRLVLVLWRIAYWLIFVLTWVILPLLGEFIDSGYRKPRDRLLYSLQSNGRYHLIVLGCGIAGLIYISIEHGFDFTSIKGLVMALAYVWGLFLAIYLLGHGIVSMPRQLLRSANNAGMLRRIQSHAPKVHDRLTDAIAELEELESTIVQLQRRKTGTARIYEDWIEELAESLSLPESRPLASQWTRDSPPSTVPTVITERYLADLTRRLQRARHQRARFDDEWDRLIASAADYQAILNSSSSKKLEFGAPSPEAVSTSRWTFLTPYMRYHLHVHVLPGIRVFLASVFSVASACIVWSELVKTFAPQISIISLSVVPRPSSSGQVGFRGQVVASLWLLYMCSAALVGVNDAKVWGNRALVRRNTYGESACWYAGQVARLTVPLSYNFLTFLPETIRRDTTFYQFLGRYIDLTPLGKGFDYFFPVFVLLPVIATLFNLYGRVKNVFGFDLLEDDDNNGTASWREGRELIDRELNSTGSLGLASRGPENRPDGGSRQRQTRWVPPTNRPRPPRSVSSDEEEEEENFMWDFARRVRNTFNLQGDLPRFQRPRWMTDGTGSGERDQDADRGGILARWFGRQATEGAVRL